MQCVHMGQDNTDLGPVTVKLRGLAMQPHVQIHRVSLLNSFCVKAEGKIVQNQLHSSPCEPNL